MTEVLRDLVNLPLRLVMGLSLVLLLIIKREVPQQLWDLVVPPKVARIIPLR